MAKPIFNVGAGLEMEDYASDLYTQMLNGVNDPTVGQGIVAPISSQYTRAVSNGDGTYAITVYDKIGAANTAWVARANNTQIGQLDSIGTPDDGTYTDGLFPWTPTTKTANAVDDVNEFLALMAPPSAPVLSNIGSSLSGSTGKLSFDTTHDITGYSYDATTINTVVQKLGNNLGIFNGTTVITGILNNSVVASTALSYVAKAFGNGNSGNLQLVVNGTLVHTSASLDTFVSGATGSGSFFTLSAATPCQFSNGNAFPALQYRTGTFTVAAAAQRAGYNYVQVSHVTAGGTYTTNTFYWYNSVNATATAGSGYSLTPSMSGSRYLSGVNYYTSGSINLAATVSNAYADVYSASASAVAPTSPQGSFSALALPATISNTATYTVNSSAAIFTTIRLLGYTTSASFSVLHPIKATFTAPTTTSGSILYDPLSNNTALVENFTSEAYRTSTVPASASSAPVAYNSTTSLATNSELQFYGGMLNYPKADFRSIGDGGTISYAQSGNPNYAGLSGNRTFIRAFQNTSGLTKANFKINIAGVISTFATVGALSGNNISVEMKFPTGSLAAGTGWLNAYADFATNQWADGNGCRAGAFGNGRALATDWGMTVGTQSIAAGEWVYMRITAPASWTGYLNSITFTWL